MDLNELTHLRWEEISLTQPSWLWLLLLIPLLLLVQRFSLVDLSRFQQALSFLARALVIALLALSVSGLASRSYSDRMAVVVLVDVSPSVPGAALMKAQEYIDTLWKSRKGKDDIRVLTFSSSTRLLKGEEKKVPQIKRHKNENASNLQAAIRHAYGIFPADTIRRMVLISDGRETQGSLLQEAARAKRLGIKLSTVAIRGPYPDEVLIQDVRIPENIRLRAPFHMDVQIFSTYADKAVPLVIYKDGFVFAARRVDLVKGINQVRFKAQVDEAGATSFQAIIRPRRDRFRGNNFFVRAASILGEPRVLYLEGTPERAHYLTQALQKEKFSVEVRSGYGVPSRLADLERYDLVLLSDIPAYQLSTGQMSLMQAYVRDLGGGLIMVGGENSFGPGGYFQTQMEKILPVRLDIEKKKESPSLALVMVIDKSCSMGSDRIALARDAAKATVRLLGDNDYVGVVAFNHQSEELVAMQSASNKSRILYDIGRLRSDGGTNFIPALRMAHTMLSGVNARVKHVILLTDGAPSESPSSILEVVQMMTAESMTISTVAVGAGSRVDILQQMAQQGSGRFYATNDVYSIPKIFTKETSKVSRSSFVEEPFRPRVLNARAQAIRGLDFSSAPYLLGYVSTKPKRGAQVILSTDLGEPLLAHWRVGLGNVAAFTSDVKNRWSVQWLSWRGYGQFWAQTIREYMRQGPSRELRMKATIRDGIGYLTVDAIDNNGVFIDKLDGIATILDPKLQSVKATMRQTGPGFYEGTFPATRHGAYVIKATFKRNGQTVGRSQASASFSYPAEWLSASPDIPRLRAAAQVGGGFFEPKESDIWARKPDERLLAHKPLWPYLVFLALCLFLLDIFLRRVRIFGRAASLTGIALLWVWGGDLGGAKAFAQTDAAAWSARTAHSSMESSAQAAPCSMPYRGYFIRRRYQRYRTKPLVLPEGRVRLISVRVKGVIDREKFKQSVEARLLSLSVCYRQMRKRYAAEKKPAASPSKTTSLEEGQATVSLQISGYGRALTTHLDASTLPEGFGDCFLWKLRGRKFFPPQDKRKVQAQLTFVAEPKAEDPPKTKQAKSTQTKRGKKAKQKRRKEEK